MFNWIKKRFKKEEPLVLTNPIKEEVKVITQPTAPVKVSKASKPKVDAVDLASMGKKELLAEAKKRGVKANASMSKAAIHAAIKNG